jgi:hypothetical protein
MAHEKLNALILRLKEEYSDLNPIIIAAPTQRCGTTLLQRSINGAGEALIYGENFLLCEMMPSMLGSAFADFEDKITICDNTMLAFKEGQRNVDATALFPDYEEYCEHLLRQFYDTMRYYQQKSEAMGYEHWGFKHQPQDIGGFLNTLTFLPHTRLVVVVRDLVDVAKSMRARWPKRMNSDDKLISFGRRWAVNTGRLTKAPKKSLFIQYEKMIEEPEKFIIAISQYVNVAMDPSEFNNKVNKHYGKAELSTLENHKIGDSGKYIAPADVSKDEKTLLLTHAQKVYEQLGYKSEKK